MNIFELIIWSITINLVWVFFAFIILDKHRIIINVKDWNKLLKDTKELSLLEIALNKNTSVLKDKKRYHDINKNGYWTITYK